MGKMTKEQAEMLFNSWISSFGPLVKGTRVVDTYDCRDKTKVDGYCLEAEFAHGIPIDTQLVDAMKVLLKGHQAAITAYRYRLRISIYVLFEDEKKDSWLNVFNKKI